MSPVRASPAGWGPDSPLAPETRCSWPTPGASAAWPSGKAQTHTVHLDSLLFFFFLSQNLQLMATDCLAHQWVRLQSAGWRGWRVLSRLLLLTQWAYAGGRQVEEAGLVLLCTGPRKSTSDPLYWVLPHCLLSVDLENINDISG